MAASTCNSTDQCIGLRDTALPERSEASITKHKSRQRAASLLQMASCACAASGISANRASFSSGTRQLARPQPRSVSKRALRSPQRQQHIVRAEGSRGPGFGSGFVVGGLLFGTLGFLFAPQISRAVLGEDQKLRLPRFLEEEEKTPEETKQDLADKIASLNAAIDDVSSQLKSQDKVEETSVA